MLTSFIPRVLCVLLILQFPIWVISDTLSPFFSQFIYESSAAKVAADLTQDRKVTQSEVTELSHKYHLNWMRVTDNSKRVLANTRPAGLGDVAISPQASSKVVDIKGARFIELTQPIEGGSMAIGYACPSLLDSLFKQQTWPSQLSAGTILLAGILNMIAFGVSYFFFVYKPLDRLNFRLKEGQDVPENFPIFVPSEVTDNLKFVRDRISNIRHEHDRAVSAARSDLTGAFEREVEDRFIGQLEKDLVTIARTNDVAKGLLQNFHDEFSGIVKASFGLDADSLPGLRLMDQMGFSEEQGKFLSNLKDDGSFSQFIRNYASVTIVDVEEIQDSELKHAAKDVAASKCIIAPLELHGQILAFFVVLASSKDPQPLKKIERILKRLVKDVTPLWHLVSRYENAFWLSRHDSLTLVQNRLSLEEMLESIKGNFAAGKISNESYFVIIEGDNFRQLINSFGPRTIDRQIQELSKTIISALDHSQRFKKSKVQFADMLYRIGGCRFLLFLEGTTLKKLSEIAETVSGAVAEKKDWSGGLPSWSVSCGIAPVVAGSEYTPQDYMEEAMIALEYVRSKRSTNMIVISKDVPEEFMNKALSRNQSGGMVTFDPAGLLRTIAQGGKTGILTVESSQGRVFWAYVEGGLPSKARLGAMYGDMAVIEFASSFTDGSLRLQDLSTIDKQTAEDMRNLGVAYNIEMPLLPLLEIANRSKETASDARILLKTPEMIIHPLVDRQTNMIERLYSKTGKPVSQVQIDATNKVWDLCTGRLSFEELVARMTDCPETLVWSGAGFLMQNKLIKFSRLRVSSHNETAAEKEAVVSKATQNATTTIFVGGPQPCPNCRAVDALSQKFCVHCGADMVKTKT